MKITNSVVDRVIEELAGEDVVPLVRKLKNKKNVSEFKLAEAIKKEINITRNMLYRLYNVNLVSFTRKKDKKKGWYIYYWTFDTKKIKYLIFQLKKRRLEKLRERIQRERDEQFFLCPNKCIRLDFEQSMNFEFKCPECGNLIEQEDNTQKIMEIEKEIILLESELKKQYKKVRIVNKQKKKAKPVKKMSKPAKSKRSKGAKRLVKKVNQKKAKKKVKPAKMRVSSRKKNR